MRFVAASPNASYTVLAEDHIRDLHGRVIQKIPGLRIQFAGGVFDSEETARGRNWSEEQRLEAERHLLSHPDFGVMRVMDGGGTHDQQYGNIERPRLYLAPGQLVPREHVEFVASQRWFQVERELGGGPPIEGQVREVAPAEEPHDPSICSFRALTPEGVVECPRAVKKDLTVCSQHERTLEGLKAAAEAVA